MIIDQLSVLKKGNLLPFRIRVFYRLVLFSHKIFNCQILSNFKIKLVENVHYDNEITQTSRKLRKDNIESNFYKERDLYIVPKCNTLIGSMRLSVFLPRLINVVFRNILNFTLKEFKNILLQDIILYFAKFDQCLLS